MLASGRTLNADSRKLWVIDLRQRQVILSLLREFPKGYTTIRLRFTSENMPQNYHSIFVPSYKHVDFGTYIIPLSLFDTATANIKTTKSVVLYKRHATNWITSQVWFGTGLGLVWDWVAIWKIHTRWRWIVFLVQCNEFNLVRIIVATTNDDAENMTLCGQYQSTAS